MLIENMFLKRYDGERRNAGFTLMEMLVTVAIILIIAGIGFFASSSIIKGMQQRELDSTAREIYIAAQNHLSQYAAQGTLAKKTDLGTPLYDDNSGIYCYVVTGDDTRLIEGSSDAKKSALYQMLPVGSIDETIRLGDTYVICYDVNTETVLGVFFAHSAISSPFIASSSGFSFVEDDCQLLFVNPGYTGEDEDGRLARQAYASASGTTLMIGYYGGEDLDDSMKAQLSKPLLKVVNGERLTAVVENVDRYIDSGKDDDDSVNLTLRLMVYGRTSGASKAITLFEDNAKTSLSYVEDVNEGETFYVFLDDITRSGGHFADIFGSDGFIPGEDIDIQAVALSNSKLSNIAVSQKVRRNSLFENIVDMTVQTTPPSQVKTARISNTRHLANLGYNISGYDPGNEDWAGQGAGYALQTQDLSWSDFQMAIATSRSLSSSPATPTEAERLRAENTSVYSALDYSYDTVATGSFMPAAPSFNLTYQGDNHKISDIYVKTLTGDAGIFSELSGASVSNLLIENPRVETADGSAGALAGSAKMASSIFEVLAYNSTSGDGDAAYEIKGSEPSGGLIGAANAISVSTCAAAVYVRSTGAAAGGLVGSSINATRISDCYTGGHTSYGTYLTDMEPGTPGRINVIAAASGGGLVGAGAFTISNCYSSCSVYGENAGGLAGQLTGSVSNSYAIGMVCSPGDGQEGALVGNGASATSSSCQYLESIAGELSPFGDKETTAVAVDADTDTFKSFAVGTAPAYPYDGSLVFVYSNVYPYKTVAELSGKTPASLPTYMTVHYGDWPRVETMTVNH